MIFPPTSTAEYYCNSGSLFSGFHGQYLSIEHDNLIHLTRHKLPVRIVKTIKELLEETLKLQEENYKKNKDKINENLKEILKIQNKE